MIEWSWALLFFVSLVCNGRAAFKLLVDWKGMLTTCRLVEATHERLADLPDDAALERDPIGRLELVHAAAPRMDLSLEATVIRAVRRGYKK